jgi:hypothetical protein
MKPLPRRDTLHAILLAGLLAACASIDPEPFEHFRNAAMQVERGTEALLLLDYQWSRRGFAEALLEGSPEDLSSLFLRFDEEEPFSARLRDPPVFLAVHAARDLLGDLASTFSDYAGLLARLAGAEGIAPGTFDDLERELNARLRNAVEALGAGAPPATEAGVALFSSSASEAFRTYIVRRRANDLREAIEQTQPLLELWASVASDAVENVRDDIKTEYDARKLRISRRYAEGRGGKNRREQERLIGEMIDLDATVVESFSALRTLRDAFRTMPGAHRQLADSIGDGEVPRDELWEFHEHGERLRQLGRRLGDE